MWDGDAPTQNVLENPLPTHDKGNLGCRWAAEVRRNRPAQGRGRHALYSWRRAWPGSSSSSRGRGGRSIASAGARRRRPIGGARGRRWRPRGGTRRRGPGRRRLRIGLGAGLRVAGGLGFQLRWRRPGGRGTGRHNLNLNHRPDRDGGGPIVTAAAGRPRKHEGHHCSARRYLVKSTEEHTAAVFQKKQYK
jgi:hypothetical protein